VEKAVREGLLSIVECNIAISDRIQNKYLGPVLEFVTVALKKMKLGEIKKFMNARPGIIDVRGMYKAKDTMEKGCYYRGL
jgi:hypothetical protein